MTSELTNKQINEEFCKEIGIKKACCYLYNKDTNEIRFYSTPSGLYKTPSGWKNIQKGKIKPCFPDLIDNPQNFCELLNLQWSMFGEIGSENYKRSKDESFEATYVKTRLNALKLCRSYGGTPTLEEYKKKVRELPFNYLNE